MNNLKNIDIDKLKQEYARRNFLQFVKYTFQNYTVNWHHKYICDILQLFSEGKIKKVILTVPPQFGKSELATRRLIPYLFGLNSNYRIAGCSYNSKFANKFNRQIQRIMISEEYQILFPETKLNRTNVVNNSKGSYLRNSKEFEIVDTNGSFISVGIGGGITGNPVDIGIIDDPIKGREEANSEVYREKLWEWYIDEFLTRLHNDSQQLIIMTRWHVDDLVGRILESPEKDEWTVINIKAICEEINEYDPRQIGEALWESKHSLSKLLKLKDLNPSSFQSLFQGNPTVAGGNLIKEHYFEIVEENYLHSNLVYNAFIDSAYTEKTQNDPTAILIVCYYQNILYLCNSITVYKDMPDLILFLKTFLPVNNIGRRSTIYIEPKASGITLKQYLNNVGFNAVEIRNEYVSKSKVERVNAITPTLTSGKNKIIKGSWNLPFLSECKNFPKDKHDDQVDCLAYANIEYFIKNLNFNSNIDYNNLPI